LLSETLPNQYTCTTGNNTFGISRSIFSCL